MDGFDEERGAGGSIYWLAQGMADYPALALGEPPPGLLSAAEMAQFGGFSVLKRRQDWLLGRWTAKRLLQRMIGEEAGREIVLEGISILPGPEGAPRAYFAPPFAALDGAFALSISHSHGRCLCAAAARAEWPLGADIERIEPRGPRFAADFFTGEELAQVNEAPPEWQDTLATAVWSAKEAALKAVRRGFSNDTRVVSCTFVDPGREAVGVRARQPKQVGEESGEGWLPLRLEWRGQAAEAGLPRMAGWWRVSGEFVLVLAVREA